MSEQAPFCAFQPQPGIPPIGALQCALRSTPYGLVKVVGGVVGVKAGAVLCGGTFGLGCVIGVLMVTIGASESVQGGTMFWDAIHGIKSSGVNPVRNLATDLMGEKAENIAYDGTALVASVSSLAVKVPVVLGTADGMNRVNSIFGTTTTVWNSAKYVPVVNTTISPFLMQTNYIFVNLYKTEVVVKDAVKESK